MKSVNTKKKYDIAYCVFVGLAFITVIIWPIFRRPLPPWLLTDLPLTDSSFVILQIQVTIAVLPLAIIALITGMSKDTLYGVPVLKYVLRLRPVLLTYNSVSILQMFMIATVYKGNIIKNLIMDCQSYTKYRPNETTGGIFVSWRRKEELPTGA